MQRGYRRMPAMLRYRGWVACWRCGRWLLGTTTCTECKRALTSR